MDTSREQRENKAQRFERELGESTDAPFWSWYLVLIWYRLKKFGCISVTKGQSLEQIYSTWFYGFLCLQQPHAPVALVNSGTFMIPKSLNKADKKTWKSLNSNSESHLLTEETSAPTGEVKIQSNLLDQECKLWAESSELLLSDRCDLVSVLSVFYVGIHEGLTWGNTTYM